MTMSAPRTRLSWSARLLIGLALVVGGAGAMTWGLAHYPPMARLLGIVPATSSAPHAQTVAALPQGTAAVPASPSARAPVASADQIAKVEQRIARVEDLSEHAAGSAGRADALVIAFAARRAIERGVALGYLENLLVQRFAQRHQAAIATIITAARKPIRLSDLVAEYETLGPALRRGGSQESWWSSVRREMGSLVEVHSAERPSGDLDVRYQRALQQLSMGNADKALAETMRMPGAGNASDWVAKVRRYIATQRALDEIESAALLESGPTG